MRRGSGGHDRGSVGIEIERRISQIKVVSSGGGALGSRGGGGGCSRCLTDPERETISLFVRDLKISAYKFLIMLCRVCLAVYGH